MSESASNLWYYQRKRLTPPALVGKDSAALSVTQSALFAQIPAVPVAEPARLFRPAPPHAVYTRAGADLAAFLSSGGGTPPPPPTSSIFALEPVRPVRAVTHSLYWRASSDVSAFLSAPAAPASSLPWVEDSRVPRARPAARLFAADPWIPTTTAAAPTASFLVPDPTPRHVMVRGRSAPPPAAELFVPTSLQPAFAWSDELPMHVLARARARPAAPQEFIPSFTAPPPAAGAALLVEPDGARVWAWRQRWLFGARPNDEWLPILGAQTPAPPAPTPGPSVYRPTFRVRRR